MVVVSFPFWVFLKLQLLVHFTKCFEEKNRAWTIMSSGDTLASKASRLVNLQYVIPRVKNIAGERKRWKYHEFDVEAQAVSEFKLF